MTQPRPERKLDGLSRIKLVLCVTAVEYGGVDSVVFALASRLDPRRFDVTVFSLGPDFGPGDRLRAVGVSVVTGSSSGASVAGLERLRRFLLRTRTTVVHCHPGSLSRLAAHLARVPIIVATYHGSFRPPSPRYPERVLRRFLDKRASALVANSRFTRDHIAAALGEPVGQIAVIYNGIDVERFRPPEPGAREATRQSMGFGSEHIIVASVARLYSDKGTADMLEGLSRAHSRGVRAGALIVGDGPERPSLERRARELHLEGFVRFLGARSDIPEVLAAADLFVSTSRTREAFGIAIVEAMGLGLPVIATSVEGVPETVDEGRSGFLIPPHDPAAVGDAIADLARRPDQRLEFGQQGRRIAVERFDVRRMVAEYEALYTRLLDRAFAERRRG